MTLRGHLVSGLLASSLVWSGTGQSQARVTPSSPIRTSVPSIPGPGACEAPVVKWEQLPDGTTGLASQYDALYPLNAEVADDFMGDGTLLLGIEWWGLYWNGEPVPPESFLVRVYTSTPDSLPGEQVYESTTTDFNEVTDDPNHYCTLFAGDPFHKLDGVQYFVSVQARLHFPPQWGWATGVGNGREVRFRGAQFGYPDWVRGTVVFGVPAYDVAFRLLNTNDVPVRESTWSSLKALYQRALTTGS
jgi:hypothetical protein